jgi:hypothetical protein
MKTRILPIPRHLSQPMPNRIVMEFYMLNPIVLIPNTMLPKPLLPNRLPLLMASIKSHRINLKWMLRHHRLSEQNNQIHLTQKRSPMMRNQRKEIGTPVILALRYSIGSVLGFIPQPKLALLCLLVDSQELTYAQSSASGSTPNDRNLASNFSFRCRSVSTSR